MPTTLRPSRKARKSRKRASGKESVVSEDAVSIYSTRQYGYLTEMELAVETRNLMKAFDEDGIDVTPKIMKTDNFLQFRYLRSKLRKHDLLEPQAMAIKHSKQFSQIRMGGLRLSMDEIIKTIDTGHVIDLSLSLHDTRSVQSVLLSIDSMSIYDLPPLPEPPEVYHKVYLTITPVIVLYEQQCTTALKGTKEGDRVEAENKAYDYLTEGKGKLRRRSDTEAQTVDVLLKTRYINTDNLNKHPKATYVSYFEMYDTLQELDKHEKIMQSNEDDGDNGVQPLPVTIHTHRFQLLNDQAAAIGSLPEFKLSIMLMKRFLAGNNYGEQQRCFRGMNIQDPLAKEHKITYTVRELFRFAPQSHSVERKAVTDISWSEKHSDILAVGYGIYSFSTMHVPASGVLCVWSIKNPDDPERIYNFNSSVVSLAFSPFLGSLLAVGFYDGSVSVFDISNPNDPPIAISHRSTSPSCEPVNKIKWIGNTVDESAEIEPFLALYHHGVVTKYRIINSPYLLGFQQIHLERIECQIDGLPIKSIKTAVTQANRHPQGLNLTLHPTQKDIYYVLTDEGAMHKCSTNYPHQHLEAEQTHEAAVNGMDFAPWSPDLFITFGNDWVVRVWMDGVFRPLITLRNRSGAIHSAFWSRTHSTVILALNRKTIDIWDIRRSIMKPVSSIQVDASYNTTCRLSRNGTSIAIGNERGNILICAFEEFPFPPHFQFDELENAIIKAVSADKDLLQEVILKGIHSYPNKTAHFAP